MKCRDPGHFQEGSQETSCLSARITLSFFKLYICKFIYLWGFVVVYCQFAFVVLFSYMIFRFCICLNNLYKDCVCVCMITLRSLELLYKIKHYIKFSVIFIWKTKTKLSKSLFLGIVLCNFFREKNLYMKKLKKCLIHNLNKSLLACINSL